MKKATSKTGRNVGQKQWVPRSATFKAGKSPVGENYTYSGKGMKGKGK